MKLHVRKGDNVVVLAGKDKGKTGKVLVANPSNNTVVVEGINMVSKNKKARNAQEKSAIIKKEGNVDVSNVQLVCPECKKATRVAHSEVDGKQVRVCKHCGASLDKKVAITKATKTKKTDKKAEAVATPKTETKKVAKPEAKKAPAKKAPAKKSASKTAPVKSITRNGGDK